MNPAKLTTIDKCYRLHDYMRRLSEYENSTTCFNRVDYVIFAQTNLCPVFAST